MPAGTPTLEESIAEQVLALARSDLEASLSHTLKRNILDSYAGICGSLRDTYSELDHGYPAGAPCSITVTFADGTTATSARDQPVGDPADPLTDAQLEQKLRDHFLAADATEVDRVLGALHNLEDQPDADLLLTPLRRRRI